MQEDNNKITRGIIDNDERIIKAFYQKYLPMVTSYVIKNSGNEYDAKDIFQDAMVIIYQKIKQDTLDIQCSLGTYVYGISKNLWRNRLRRNSKETFQDTINDRGEEEVTIENIDRKEKILLIQKYLLTLGEGCKEILMLFFSGHSLKEIAEQRNLSESYARKRKFICQKNLMKLIENDSLFNELKESSNYK